jgi:hypothetical protein
MKYTSIDTIVRSVLLQQGKPLHFYIDCLIYGRECLRELYFDDLQVINTVLLDVHTTGNYIDLPCDFVDWVKVGIRVGQMVKPLVQDQSINPLHNYNSSGAIVDYVQSPPDATNLLYTFPISLFWGTTTINEYGESIGRLFGWGAGYESDTFKYLPERNQIQLNESLAVDKIVLEYIGNGMSCDAATQVDVYAMQTITDYIKWQLKENSRSYSDGEKERLRQIYLGQRIILRARKDELTINDMKRIDQRNYMATPKSP